MNHETRPEINLDNLPYSIQAIQQKVLPSKVIPAVKADAFGFEHVPIERLV